MPGNALTPRHRASPISIPAHTHSASGLRCRGPLAACSLPRPGVKGRQDDTNRVVAADGAHGSVFALMMGLVVVVVVVIVVVVVMVVAAPSCFWHTPHAWGRVAEPVGVAAVVALVQVVLR